MELIKNWLAGSRNFVVGFVLYKKLGIDEKLKKLFDTVSPDKYLQDRLARELEALLEKPKLALQQPAAQSDAEEMPKSGDSVLEAIRNEWMPLYQRMNYLRHELDRYEDNTPDQVAIRKGLAKEILELEQQCMRLWDGRDYYQEHGKLPEAKPIEREIPQDPVKLVTAMQTAERNIRRNKAKLEKHPGNAVYALKVKQYEEELERLTKSKPNESPGKQTGLQPGSDTTVPGK